MNARYYISNEFENPYFTEKELKYYNNWLKENYAIWLLFERITQLQLSNINVTRYSAYEIIWQIRKNHKKSIRNDKARFLAFMYHTKHKAEVFEIIIPNKRRYGNQ